MDAEIIIIGAGLTGLTTAYTLARKGRKVMVVEKMDRAGGQIHTHCADGFTFESGPNTGTLSYPEVAELMTDLEKTSQGQCRLETAPKSSKRRLIWKGNRFHDLPAGPLSGISTPLFTFADKLRILGEPWRKKGNNPDESVGSLARRRLGKSFVDYAVDPFLSGVYAGNPDTLITRYALPKLYQLEQDYGSFIRGSIAKAKEPKSDRDKLATKQVFSAAGGLSQITDAMARYIGPHNLILSAREVAVMPTDEGWQVGYTDKEGHECKLTCHKVVTTCGSYCLPSLLPFAEAETMKQVNNLTYAPVAEVSVGVRDTLNGDYQAFGGLVPSCERQQVLGILYPSACFAGRAPEGGALFSYFIGGVRHSELVNLSDDEMISLVEKYFHSMLKFPNNVKPDLIRIFRHKHAIPQYELSTGERLNAINKLQRNYPGLTIAGNLRDGIGMAHRIKQAVDIANTL